MKLHCLIGLLTACALSLASTQSNATTIIHDFDDGTVGPFSVLGGTQGVSAFVLADSSPEFAGDQSIYITDTEPSFQTVLQLGTGDFNDGLLPLFKENSIIEADINQFDFDNDGGANIFLVIGGPSNGFGVITLDDYTDGVWTVNYDTAQGGLGRQILNEVDLDDDGFVDAGAFLNLWIVQQTTGDATFSFIEYDNFRLRVPEPTTGLLAGMLVGGVVAARRR